VTQPTDAGAPRVCMVGSGFHFTSGISYHTCCVANALAERGPTSAILMRRLVPRRLYPGRERVGTELHALRYRDDVDVVDGVDWYWVPSIAGALAHLRATRPEVVVLQWWTGAVLHTYLAIAAAARALGATVLIEWHEVQDVGEVAIPGARRYVHTLVRPLLRLASGHVVHSEFDRHALEATYGLDLTRRTAIVPHGPYHHYVAAPGSPAARAADAGPITAPAAPPAGAPSDDDGVVDLLFFGVIRPFKGLEDLVEAFDGLDDDEAAGFRLTIAGEVWEGWGHAVEAAERSRHRGRITIIPRYLSDAEASSAFAAADVVVLPYRRSSTSGPLHIAMAHGLPVVISDVGGLTESVADYEGALLVPPGDPAALRDVLRASRRLAGRRFASTRSWDDVAAAYLALHRSATDAPATTDLSPAR
jgi:glycosyltransferase involved in cell wall biosynthesis